MISCMPPLPSTSERYSGTSSTASMVAAPCCRSSMVSNSGTMCTDELVAVSADPGSNSPASLSSTMASSMSLTEVHMLMM